MVLYNIDKLIRLDVFKKTLTDELRIKKCEEPKFWSHKKVTYYVLKYWWDEYKFNTEEEVLAYAKKRYSNYIIDKDLNCYEKPKIRFLFPNRVSDSKMFNTDTEMYNYLKTLKEKYPQIVNYFNPNEL